MSLWFCCVILLEIVSVSCTQAMQGQLGCYPCSYPQVTNSGFVAPSAPGFGPPPSYAHQEYPPQQGGQYPPGPPESYAGTFPPGPIVNQPGMGGGGLPVGGWASSPRSIPNCPPGLEYLTMIDHLFVAQKVEVLEALTGFEARNKFLIKNKLDQLVYYAEEDSGCLARNCCGHLRPFDMIIGDSYRNEVIHLHRPLSCDSCCFPCCLQTIEVSSPPGTVIGTVEQEWSLFCPSFLIKNASADTVLRIEGPLCTMSFCGSDVEFKIMSSDGKVQVGKISKRWSTIVREALTDADYFGITFPMDLDVRMKAVMLGACILIDSMYFEKTSSGSQL